MKWGKDNEERAAVAQKAHDAYATASAAREAIAGVMERCEALEAALDEAHHDLAQLHKTLGALSLRVTELERPKTTAKPTRKAA